MPFVHLLSLAVKRFLVSHMFHSPRPECFLEFFRSLPNLGIAQCLLCDGGMPDGKCSHLTHRSMERLNAPRVLAAVMEEIYQLGEALLLEDAKRLLRTPDVALSFPGERPVLKVRWRGGVPLHMGKSLKRFLPPDVKLTCERVPSEAEMQNAVVKLEHRLQVSLPCNPLEPFSFDTPMTDGLGAWRDVAFRGRSLGEWFVQLLDKSGKLPPVANLADVKRGLTSDKADEREFALILFGNTNRVPTSTPRPAIRRKTAA